MGSEPLLKEYYAILQTVNDFDKRLLTVKGWGVTLSLAALAWGFQFGHYGLFLVASLSSVGFWIIEGVTKRHQMRYYVRMREIEVIQYRTAAEDNLESQSSPRIDWTWFKAPKVFAREQVEPLPAPSPHVKSLGYRFVWFLPHVLLPHAISFAAGLLLLLLGIQGRLGSMSW